MSEALESAKGKPLNQMLHSLTATRSKRTLGSAWCTWGDSKGSQGDKTSTTRPWETTHSVTWRIAEARKAVAFGARLSTA